MGDLWKSWFLFSVLTLVLGHKGHEAHVMHHPTSFSDPGVIEDEAHLKEHMKKEIDTDKPMTPEELQFHYFRLHDTNNDTMLDGLELLQAISHIMPDSMYELSNTSGMTPLEIGNMKNKLIREMIKSFVDSVDSILAMDDQNKDGYVSYTEFMIARKRNQQWA